MAISKITVLRPLLEQQAALQETDSGALICCAQRNREHGISPFHEFGKCQWSHSVPSEELITAISVLLKLNQPQ